MRNKRDIEDERQRPSLSSCLDLPAHRLDPNTRLDTRPSSGITDTAPNMCTAHLRPSRPRVGVRHSRLSPDRESRTSSSECIGSLDSLLHGGASTDTGLAHAVAGKKASTSANVPLLVRLVLASDISARSIHSSRSARVNEDERKQVTACVYSSSISTHTMGAVVTTVREPMRTSTSHITSMRTTTRAHETDNDDNDQGSMLANCARTTEGQGHGRTDSPPELRL